MLVFTTFVAGCGSSSSVTTTTMAATTTTAAAVTTSTVAAVTTTTTGTTTTTIALPPAPVLIASGSLHHIYLAWTDMVGSHHVTGYNVYRSADGTSFSKIASAITSNSYDDPKTSPADDDVYYYYKVRSINAAGNSPDSNKVRTMHGTRLPAFSSSLFTTSAGDSPYVAEGAVTVEGGDLIVNVGTTLEVLDSAFIDVEQGHNFSVWGTIRSVPSTAEPAVITSHHIGEPLSDSEGIEFDLGGVSYNSADNTGTLVKNTWLTGLKGNAYAVSISNSCAPKFVNNKLVGNSGSGTSALNDATPGSIIEHCWLDHIYLIVGADQRGTPFTFDHNFSQLGYWSMEFWSQTAEAVSSGQIADNSFDGTLPVRFQNYNSTPVVVPLGTNYWGGATPTSECTGSIEASADFTPVLGSSPSGVGPNW